MITTTLVVLGVTSLGAATVNGALGYGYSTISVPIALLVVAGRVLNPALVVVEVALNLYALWWYRDALRRVIGRVAPLAVGLVPGVVVGALLLGHIGPTTVRLGAFLVLLPLVLLQAAGKRWIVRDERRASFPLGGGVGLLFGLTTISGPPLALFWKNQGLSREDFKAAIACVRAIEATCALIVYASLGLLVRESTELLPWIAPGVVVGIPLGAWLVRRVDVEVFRRVCTSFDADIVAFGLAHSLVEAGVPGAAAYQLLAATIVVDARLLRGFFRSRRPAVAVEPALLEAA